MRSMMLMMVVTASMAGCAAQVPESESKGATPEAVGTTGNALRIGRGVATESCPGGGAPACVVCTGDECIYACKGGFKCIGVGEPICSYPGECRTVSFAPGGFGTVAY